MTSTFDRRALGAALLVTTLALAACQSASVFDLEIDDCWKEASTQILEVEVVPCEEPHPYQVFALIDYTESDDYPGEAALASFAGEQCRGAFEDYVGRDYDSSEFYFYALRPSETTWAEGDREIVCSLALQDESDWTGSGKDSGR